MQRNVVRIELAERPPAATSLADAVRGAGFAPRHLWVEQRAAGDEPARLWRLDVREAAPVWEVETRSLDAALAERPAAR